MKQLLCVTLALLLTSCLHRPIGPTPLFTIQAEPEDFPVSATNTFIGPGDWGFDSSWSLGHLPTFTEFVHIPGGLTAEDTAHSGPQLQAHTLRVDGTLQLNTFPDPLPTLEVRFSVYGTGTVADVGVVSFLSPSPAVQWNMGTGPATNGFANITGVNIRGGNVGNHLQISAFGSGLILNNVDINHAVDGGLVTVAGKSMNLNNSIVGLGGTRPSVGVQFIAEDITSSGNTYNPYRTRAGSGNHIDIVASTSFVSSGDKIITAVDQALPDNLARLVVACPDITILDLRVDVEWVPKSDVSGAATYALTNQVVGGYDEKVVVDFQPDQNAIVTGLRVNNGTNRGSVYNTGENHNIALAAGADDDAVDVFYGSKAMATNESTVRIPPDTTNVIQFTARRGYASFEGNANFSKIFYGTTDLERATGNGDYLNVSGFGDPDINRSGYRSLEFTSINHNVWRYEGDVTNEISAVFSSGVYRWGLFSTQYDPPEDLRYVGLSTWTTPTSASDPWSPSIYIPIPGLAFGTGSGFVNTQGWDQVYDAGDDSLGVEFTTSVTGDYNTLYYFRGWQDNENGDLAVMPSTHLVPIGNWAGETSFPYYIGFSFEGEKVLVPKYNEQDRIHPTL